MILLTGFDRQDFRFDLICFGILGKSREVTRQKLSSFLLCQRDTMCLRRQPSFNSLGWVLAWCPRWARPIFHYIPRVHETAGTVYLPELHGRSATMKTYMDSLCISAISLCIDDERSLDLARYVRVFLVLALEREIFSRSVPPEPSTYFPLPRLQRLPPAHAVFLLVALVHQPIRPHSVLDSPNDLGSPPRWEGWTRFLLFRFFFIDHGYTAVI